MDTLSQNWPLIAVVLGLILFQFLFRQRQRPEMRQREIVQNLLSEVKLNEALLEVLNLQRKLPKFILTGWKMSKNRLDFLSKDLQTSLSEAFAMAEDINRQIDDIKRGKPGGYSASIDISKLREPLTKSRQGLEEWLLIHVGSKEPPESSSLFDRMFGRG